MLCSRLQLSPEALSNHYVSDERAMVFLPSLMLCSRLQLSPEAVSNHYVSDERAMAFLPKFETDIFISYARVDNEAATGEGWVAQFVKHLEIEISKLAGRIGLVKLWWEPTGKN